MIADVVGRRVLGESHPDVGKTILNIETASFAPSVRAMRAIVAVRELYLTWAVCEWHLNSLFHARKLFDHALYLTKHLEEESSKLRSFILYVMARFEYSRGELRRAQHFIGVCLKENLLPGGNAKVWELWAAVAHAMGDAGLARQCQEQSSTLAVNGQGDSTSVAQMLQSRMKGPDIQEFLRRDPWHQAIFGSSSMSSNKYLNLAMLPDNNNNANIPYEA